MPDQQLPDTPAASAIAHLAARLFPRSASPQVERVEQGVSTYVYRLRYDELIFYLRVLPEAGASFAPEVFAHHWLRQREARVGTVFKHRCHA